MTHVYFNESQHLVFLIRLVHEEVKSKSKHKSEKKESRRRKDRVGNVINLINLLIQGKHYQASAY